MAHRRTNFLDNIRAKLLNRKSTNIALELTNYGITEPAVVEVKDVLHHLSNRKHHFEPQIKRNPISYIVAVRVLDKG